MCCVQVSSGAGFHAWPSGIDLQARGAHGAGFDRLLIESRLFGFLGIEALRFDRHEIEDSAHLHARLLCAALPVRRESF